MTARPPRTRGRASAALVAITAALLAAAAITGYVRSELVDDRALAARATSALDDEEVRRLLATRMVNGLAEVATSDLLAARPLLISAITAVVDTPPFRRLLTRAVERRHRALVKGESDFVLTLPRGARPLVESLRSVSPAVARALPPDLELRVAALDRRDFELRTARLLQDVAGWWWPLLAAALLSAAACAAMAGGVRQALVQLGSALAAAGLAVAVLVVGLGTFVASHASHAADLDDEGERQAVGAVWAALFGDLRSAALIAALGGAVVVALAWGAPARERAAAALASLRRCAGSSSGTAARVARSAFLILLGVTLVFQPYLVWRSLLVIAGVGLVLFGAAELSGRAQSSRAGAQREPLSPRLLAGTVMAVVAVAAAAVVLVLPAPGSAPAGEASYSGSCNGSGALCDRRLNEVVFPATHNSYAVANRPGWFFANQRFPIDRQLRDGIRAFLIDIHWGVPDANRDLVRTALDAEGSSRNKVVQELGPTAVATADRLAGRVGVERPEGSPRLYLCHTLCELGSEPLGEQLQEFASFLDANPGEVVILFVEPYVPVAHIERAMAEAGLLEQAARLERDEPLPTLGELISEGTRLVVLAEEEGGSRDWYLPGFSFAQDTPIGATRPDESCRRFRGTPDGPLFLVNHWDTTFPPSPRRNARVGGDVLRERLARCRRSRRLVPNMVAVDFHERSGVVDLARRLNAEQR